MKLTIRFRLSVWFPAGVLLALLTGTASGNPIYKSGDLDEIGSSGESWTVAESSDELLVTSTSALSRAALTGLITDASNFAPSLPESLQPPASTEHNECSMTGTGALFNVCFGIPSLLPIGHYYFMPQVSVANGEFYWLFESKPVSAAVVTSTSAKPSTSTSQP